jgi:hypothetical protein
MEDKTTEILNEIKQHIEVLSEPSITRSVFNTVQSTDEVMDEDIPVSILTGQHCVSTRIGYGNGELYDIYVVKI